MSDARSCDNESAEGLPCRPLVALGRLRGGFCREHDKVASLGRCVILLVALVFGATTSDCRGVHPGRRLSRSAVCRRRSRLCPVGGSCGLTIGVASGTSALYDVATAQGEADHSGHRRHKLIRPSRVTPSLMCSTTP